MKKSFLILSVLALACNASAFDELVPGTAEAPNYYFFSANRGNPYLTYSEAGVELTWGEGEAAVTQTTQLVRTTTQTLASLWAVYEGDEEGFVVIKNAAADVYLMGFFDQNGQASTEVGCYANVVDDPVEIYPLYRGVEGTYSLNLYNETGWNYNDPDDTSKGYVVYSLDASGGGVTCGNWFPDENGALWKTTKFEVPEGQTVEEVWFNRSIANAVNSLNLFIESVPQVASVLETGIETIKGVAHEGDYDAKIAELKESAYAAANAEMMTCFADKTLALKNVRRMDIGTADGPYVATNMVNRRYAPTSTFADPLSAFTFKSNGAGGYTLYNEATQTYIGVVVEQVEDQTTHEMKDVDKVSPVSDADKATVFYPCLKAVGDYYGIALSRNSDYSGQGINFQSWAGGAVDYYSVNDGGSVWNLIEVTQEGMVADVIASVEDALTPYIPNVYVIKEIFEKAISDTKALTFSAELLTKATEIKEQAFADANELLANGLGGKNFALKYLRGNNFVAVGTVNEALNYVHVEDGLDPSAQFTFKAREEGGYFIYNDATESFFGPQQAEEFDNNGNLKDDLTIAMDEDDAQELYPVLYTYGGLYGIALPFIEGAETTTPAINMNGYDGLHAYMIGDAGSIWGIYDPAETSIEEVGAAVAPVRTGIYDLSGRKLSAPVRGINIINGKKVLVK